MMEHDGDGALPGVLPPGERVLWQGRPDWVRLARSAYLGDLAALYFAVLVAWRFAEAMAEGAAPGVAFAYATAIAPIALAALALIAFAGWMGARVSVYTITDRRVVMRIGAALTMAVNVPFKRVAAASLRMRGSVGDVAIETGGAERFSYFLLWPHARPWRIARPAPMLRALRDAPEAARVLGEALAAYQAAHGMELDATPPQAARTERRAPRGGAAMTPAE